MNYEINRKANKSGKGVVFFVTVDGFRINTINYGKKCEAISFFKELVKRVGSEKILAAVESAKQKQAA